MATVKRINVVFLYVLNLERAREFYETVFGLEKPVVDAKWWVEYAIGDGSHLALHQFDAKHTTRDGLGTGSVKFSIEVDDIQTYAKKFKEMGGHLRYEPHLEYGFWLAEFEDVEGNSLRLYQKANNQETPERRTSD